jgi:hypothetical protein
MDGSDRQHLQCKGVPGRSLVAWVSACAIILFFAAIILFMPLRYVVGVMALDDCGYYLQVARNLSHGSLSFDGINPTNGFHPLWFIFIAPVYLLVSNIDAAFLLVMFLSAVLAGASVFVLVKLCGKMGFGTAASAAALVMLLGAVFQKLYGMESWLLILLTIALIERSVAFRVFEKHAVPGRQLALLGFLAGLMFLARLDSVFYVMSFLAAVCVAIIVYIIAAEHSWKRRIGAIAERGLWLLTPAAMLAACYFTWNYAIFGHLGPVSGSLKTTFPNISQSAPAMPWSRYAVPAFLILLGALISLIRRGAERATGIICFVSGLGLMFLLLYIKLYFAGGVYVWYFAQQYAGAALGAALFVEALVRLIDKRRARTILNIAACVLAAMLISHRMVVRYGKSRPGGEEPAYDAAIWARQNIPEGAVCAMNWAGMFGYFADRQVVNLDGVINGYEYVDALEKGEFSRFLDRCNVQYLVSECVVEPEVLSGAYEEYAFGPRLHKETAEGNFVPVRRTNELYNAPFNEERRRLIVWKR